MPLGWLRLDLFAENAIQVLPHRAYSPDLARATLLFPQVKKQLREITFDSPKGATSAYNSAF